MRLRRSRVLFAVALLTLGLVACSAEDSDTDEGREPAGTSAPTASAPASAAAEPPAGTAPGTPFAVGSRTVKLNRGGDRPLPVTIWYPATGSAGNGVKRGAVAADGRFPVVMFSHGLGGKPDDYRALVTGWAAAGFVVAAPTFPLSSRAVGMQDTKTVLDVLNQPADVSYVLTELLKLDGTAGDPLRGRLDADRIAAAGHSAGGVTTVGLFTAGRDERLDAGIVFAGSALGVGSAFAGATAPQLFVHGELDDVVSYASGKAAYDAVPWPKAMLSLPKGDHGRGVLADAASLRLVTATTTSFLRWTLYRDPAAKQQLAADAAGSRLATFDNRL